MRCEGRKASRENLNVDLRRILVLRGPNVWSLDPVLEAWLDLGEPREGGPVLALPPGFPDRLRSRLASPDGPATMPGSGPGETLAGAVGWVTQQLQAKAWKPVASARVRGTATLRVYRLAIPFEEESLAREALAVACALCRAALDGRPFDLE